MDLLLLGIAECDVHIVATKLSEYERHSFAVSSLTERIHKPIEEFAENPDADASIIESLDENAYEDLNKLQSARTHLIRSVAATWGSPEKWKLALSESFLQWARTMFSAKGLNCLSLLLV
ncbi:hypothetical protein NLM16_39180 [Bradyrhizobium brasilense]|uniref:hypothetical protein n=1 Tax=Bradyrhizobium brasilense TaxID=1419277 RepID=UPI0028780865|nr:hypothetical protein [Bradyrhizobium brasilense]MCP3420134.1 hypothetical protein [Bradyrhizobium brasilense]